MRPGATVPLPIVNTTLLLPIDSNRNTNNIKIIKIDIESANLCGKTCDRAYAHFAEICKNAATCEICGNRVFGM